MKKLEHCILHIGTEKTGSTTIQDFLFHNRRSLLERGYLYPKSFLRKLGRPSHVLLATYAQDKDKTEGLRRSVGIRNLRDVEKHRRNIVDALEKEISSTRNVGTMVLSNEHCSSRLVESAEVQDLIDLLRSFVERISVVVYLRPQDEMALSMYSTRVKEGNSGGDPFAYARKRGDFYDHDVLLSRWEEVVGRENLTVRLYDRSEMVGKDVVNDFMDVTGIPDQGLVRRSWQNRSLSPEGLRIMDRFNPYFPRRMGPIRNPLRLVFQRFVESRYPGRGPEPDIDAAHGFYSQFQESNESVRARYFPQRESLFNKKQRV